MFFSDCEMKHLYRLMEQLPATAGRQELEQRMEQLPGSINVATGRGKPALLNAVSTATVIAGAFFSG